MIDVALFGRGFEFLIDISHKSTELPKTCDERSLQQSRADRDLTI